MMRSHVGLESRGPQPWPTHPPGVPLEDASTVSMQSSSCSKVAVHASILRFLTQSSAGRSLRQIIALAIAKPRVAYDCALSGGSESTTLGRGLPVGSPYQLHQASASASVRSLTCFDSSTGGQSRLTTIGGESGLPLGVQAQL